MSETNENKIPIQPSNFYGYSNDNSIVSPRGNNQWANYKPIISIDSLRSLNSTLRFDPSTNSWNYCDSETDSEFLSESESKSWTDSENSIESSLKEFMKTEIDKTKS